MRGTIIAELTTNVAVVQSNSVGRDGSYNDMDELFQELGLHTIGNCKNTVQYLVQVLMIWAKPLSATIKLIQGLPVLFGCHRKGCPVHYQEVTIHLQAMLDDNPPTVPGLPQ